MKETPEKGKYLSALKCALVAVKDMRAKLEAAEQTVREPVAIVGMACRFPALGRDIEGYWCLSEDGLDGCFLSDVDGFNAGFLNHHKRAADNDIQLEKISEK